MNHKSKTGPMTAEEVLIDMGIERCPECNCNVGDDWEFEDFTCKTVVKCPQCKEIFHTDNEDE